MKSSRTGENSRRRRSSAPTGRKTKAKSRKPAKISAAKTTWLERSLHQTAPLEWLPTPYQALLQSQKRGAKSKRTFH
jgi:hypothetical protein